MPDPDTGHDRSPRRSSTIIGSLGRPARAAVDSSGGILTRAGRTIEWWVGAEDRWHVPRDEAAVRQRLVDGMPVIETAMRVPGGDVVHRAYGVLHGGRELVVVEVENRTAVPVALALAVDPGSGDRARSRSIAVTGSAVVVDEEVAIAFARTPAHAAAGPGIDAVREVVTSAGAQVPPVAFDEPAGRAAAAVVVPLPHTAVARAVIPLDEVGASGGEAAALAAAASHGPAAERVAHGWLAQLRRGLELALPDSPLAEAVAANRAFVLLAHGGADVVDGPFRSTDPTGRRAVAILATLDRWGFRTEVAEILAARSDRPADGATLAALHEHLRCGGDAALVDELSSSVAAGVRLAERGGDTAALAHAAAVLELAGQGRAAEAVRRRIGPGDTTGARPTTGPTNRPIETGSIVVAARLLAEDPIDERLAWALSTASPTHTWPESIDRDGRPDGRGHDLVASAAFLDLARDALVGEATDDGAAVLSAVPTLLDAWRGAPIEVHDAPTSAGDLSFAVRWHGPRPALLWELTSRRAPAATSTPVVRAPGLDTAWASREPRGEALLSGGVQSVGGRPPDQGASFS